jgi:hypothetical protein
MTTELQSAVIYAVVTALFNLIFAHKSQIADWAEANPRLASVLKLTRALGIDPWNVISSLQLLFTKKLPTAQKNGQFNAP